MSNQKQKNQSFYNLNKRNFTNDILNHSRNINSNSTLYTIYNTNSNIRKFNNTLRDSFLNMNSSLTKSSYNNYINRPIVNFTPKMPLHNLDSKSFINPSKLKYIVSVVPPSCHLKKRKNKKSRNYTIEEFEKGLFSSIRKNSLNKTKETFLF